MACAAVALAGCATSQNTAQGGTAGQFDTSMDAGQQFDTGTGYSEGPYPKPAASPTMRPGMNRDDIRDPQTFAQPGPGTPP